MAIFKCKMCGGTIEFEQGATVGVCDSCGTKQTLPRLDDEQRANLYGRANHFRRNSDYDKAMGIYEQILNEDKTDAEAYWSIVLCRYGIEYVEDPKTHKRIPTVNRAQYTSIFADADYQSALQYADTLQKSIYEAEAKAIDDIQKGILAISQKEEPFDVFICYKETDEAGKRTPDSVLANDLYHQLVQEGFKVFFSRITLEDKLGSEYEPYIFAALNSAKVMVVLGTKPEYFNAVWVKNEWSRYLTLVKASDGKKMLIPAYKDMDPYDLPDAFSNLQAQDMSKLGFMQDLIRGIRKIVSADEPKPAKETVVVQSSTPASSNYSGLLKRAFIFLEDGKWQEADEYCEKVLDKDPECAEAYLGKLLAALHISKREDLKNAAEPFDGNDNCKKASRYDAKLAKELADANAYIRERNEAKEKEEQRKAEEARKEKKYQHALEEYHKDTKEGYLEAKKLFESLPSDYKDVRVRADECRERIEELRVLEDKKEAERAEAARIAVEKRKMMLKKIAIIGTPIVVGLIVLLIVLNTVIIPNNKYNKAVALADAGEYKQAVAAFEALGKYKDANQRTTECRDQMKKTQFNSAIALADSGEYEQAIAVLEGLGDYGDAGQKVLEYHYCIAIKAEQSCDFRNAALEYGKADSYKDAREKSRILALQYQNSISGLIDAGYSNTVGLSADGKVIPSNKATDEWSNVIALSAGSSGYTLGLLDDGTVVASGSNKYGQCDVETWSDIVAISAGHFHSVGLRSNGTVIATKYTGEEEYDYGQCAVDQWTDIVAISAGTYHTVGLRADGTVVSTKFLGPDSFYWGQCKVEDWKDIVAIATYGDVTVGLKSNGTVVAVGYTGAGQCNVDDWTDIVAIAAGQYHTIGLRSDGTVVAAGSNEFGQSNVDSWKDVVAVTAGNDHTVALCSDGSIVATGEYVTEENSWKNMKLPK